MTGYWLYRWNAVCTEGNLREGSLLGTDKMSVRRYLISRDLQPIRVRIRAYLPGNYWHNVRLAEMTSQLALLMESGITLRDSLHLLADDHPNAGWRCLLRLLGERIEQGHTLSLACADFPRVFSPLYCALVALGELTGRLEQCCRLLAEHESRLTELHRKIRGALRYPLFICLSAAAVLILMLVWVLPEFARLYEGINAPLPAPTRNLMALANGVAEHGATALISFMALFGACARFWGYHPRWRRRIQASMLSWPLLGGLLRQHNLQQLFQTLAITHRAGITLDNGLEMAARVLRHPCYAESALALHRHISQGFALHLAFRRHRLFPAHCHQLIRTGEYTGTLGEVFQQLARLHEQQTFRLADGLTRLAEPALLLILGGLVCALVVVLYLPLLQLGDVFSHF